MTKEQAMNCHHGQEIHYTGRHQCTRTVGPRGGETLTITRVRPSGRCQTWKTRPTAFRLPVKYGMYEHGEITHGNCDDFHLASECPLNNSGCDKCGMADHAPDSNLCPDCLKDNHEV
jgi:hypothetical protein